MLKTVLLLCLCLSSTFALPQKWVYMGRSADITIESETTQDSVMLLKGEQFSSTQINNLEDTRFADLFSHVMGSQPFHVDADRTGFPSSSLFNKPRAALLVAVDSVGSGILNKFPTLSILKNVQTSKITTPAVATNTHMLLATLATGVTPSEHGIVGPFWRRPVVGSLVEAYSSEGPSFSANLADIISQESKGKSLVISASSSSSFASALGVHPKLAHENAHAYSFENGAFVSRYENAGRSLELSQEDLSTLLNDISISGVTFSYKNSEDLALLAELAFVSNLISKLNTDSTFSRLAADDKPDVYSFVFASLKGIQAKYGEDSTEFAAALTLVDKAIETLSVALNKHYDNRVATAIMALNARDTSSEALKQIVFSKVSTLLHSEEDFAAFYPSLYIRTQEFDGHARDIMCSNLQRAISGATVYCSAPIVATRAVRALSDDPVISNNSNCPIITNETIKQEADDLAYIWAFWLNFFITLIITGFVGWGVYCMAFVGSDASKDSLLFRATGRHHHQN